VIVFAGENGKDFRNETWAFKPGPAPEWTLIEAGGLAPAGRFDACAVYDSVRDRVVMFGGDLAFSTSEVWALELSAAPYWHQLEIGGFYVAGRALAGAVWDAPRDRMILLGGTHGNEPQNDVVFLNFAVDPPRWEHLVANGASPPFRSGHLMVYDPPNDRVIVYGGMGLNDTWILSLAGNPSWSELVTSSQAPPFGGAEGAFNPRQQRLLIQSYGDLHRSTWVLDLDVGEWRNLPDSTGDGSGFLDGPTIDYDPSTDRFILYGGWDWIAEANTWQRPGSGESPWTLLDPADGLPAQRRDHSLIYDSRRHRVILFGGRHGDPFLGEETSLNDVWSMDPTSGRWSPVVTTGTAPAPRSAHSAIYDPIRDRMIVFGGNAGGSIYFTPVALSFAETPPRWEQLPTSGVLLRQDHAAVYDPRGDRMLVFGGTNGDQYYSDVWALSLSSPSQWIPIAAAGSAPSPRGGVAAVLDTGRNRLVLFSGRNHFGVISEDSVWTLALGETPIWSAVLPPEVPGARAMPTAALDAPRDRILMLTTNVGSKVWALSLAALQWVELNLSGPVPQFRNESPGVADDQGELMFFSGGPPWPTRDSWKLTFDAVTAVLVSIVEARSVGPGTHIVWEVSSSTPLLVERRSDSGPWQTVERGRSDDVRRIVLDDAPLAEGSWTYRLVDLSGQMLSGSEVTILVDASARTLSLTATSPSVGAPRITFRTLPGPPAVLELFDATGRKIESQLIPASSEGIIVLPVHNPGVYLTRLGQAERKVFGRIVILGQ
jgi:galactose oxidase-like protein